MRVFLLSILCFFVLLVGISVACPQCDQQPVQALQAPVQCAPARAPIRPLAAICNHMAARRQARQQARAQRAVSCSGFVAPAQAIYYIPVQAPACTGHVPQRAPACSGFAPQQQPPPCDSHGVPTSYLQ